MEARASVRATLLLSRHSQLLLRSCLDVLFLRSKMNHPWFGPAPILALLAPKEDIQSFAIKVVNGVLFFKCSFLQGSCDNSFIAVVANSFFNLQLSFFLLRFNSQSDKVRSGISAKKESWLKREKSMHGDHSTSQKDKDSEIESWRTAAVSKSDGANGSTVGSWQTAVSRDDTRASANSFTTTVVYQAPSVPPDRPTVRVNAECFLSKFLLCFIKNISDHLGISLGVAALSFFLVESCQENSFRDGWCSKKFSAAMAALDNNLPPTANSFIIAALAGVLIPQLAYLLVLFFSYAREKIKDCYETLKSSWEERRRLRVSAATSTTSELSTVLVTKEEESQKNYPPGYGTASTE